MREVALVPDVTLVEVTYLVQRGGGIPATTRFLDRFDESGFSLIALEPRDLRRVRDLMQQYADANLDFVDTCIIAIAERLNICRIGTVDRRDFSMIRTTHCDHFELLPVDLF